MQLLVYQKSIDTAEATSSPVITPTNTPKPTAKPTAKPTVKPTAKPTVKPTVKPTAKPTATPAQTTTISAPKPFKAVSTSKSITLKWTAPKNATGFEIYRKDFYDGKYKKVKTINNVKTQKYVDSNVESYHEYYYKIRSVNSKSAKKLYSSYLSLTVSAMQHKAAITTSSLKLLKKPSAQADTLKTLPKKFILEYTGKTTYKNNTTFLHMYYYTKNKKYNCWLPADSKLKYYKGGTAKTSTKLLKEAKSITNAIVNVPSGSYVAVLSTKKVGLLSFYKVRYSDSSKSYVGYVTAKHIVLQ